MTKLTCDGEPTDSKFKNLAEYNMAVLGKINELGNKPKVTRPSYELLAEVDIQVCTTYGGNQVYFESTLEIRDYGGDMCAYLGGTDISNEIPYEKMEFIVEDNQ